MAEKYQRPPYYGILRETGTDKDQRMSEGKRLSKKRLEADMN
jgi:hypothetical protein